MAKSVRVHEDTHTTLMQLKATSRSESLDQVIRQLVFTSTGRKVEEPATRREGDLTSFLTARPTEKTEIQTHKGP